VLVKQESLYKGSQGERLRSFGTHDDQTEGLICPTLPKYGKRRYQHVEILIATMLRDR
jgi:hypothetical protein